MLLAAHPALFFHPSHFGSKPGPPVSLPRIISPCCSCLQKPLFILFPDFCISTPFHCVLNVGSCGPPGALLPMPWPLRRDELLARSGANQSRDKLIAPASLCSRPSATFWTVVAFLSSFWVQLAAQLRSQLLQQNEALTTLELSEQSERTQASRRLGPPGLFSHSSSLCNPETPVLFLFVIISLIQ